MLWVNYVLLGGCLTAAAVSVARGWQLSVYHLRGYTETELLLAQWRQE